MKKTILSLTLFILALITVQPQHLNGVIYYQNSGGQTAAGVKVSAIGCSSEYSNSNGMFTLNCPTKKAGEKLSLDIGSTDGTGKNIEVVNARGLELIRLADSGNDDIVKIIVCEPEKKAEAVLRYNNILDEYINKIYDKKLKEIKAELAENNKNRAILMVKIDKLREERDKALEKVKEQATFIANINLDEASEMVNSAIRKLEEERDIEGALEILDNEKLDKTYELEMANKERAESGIKKVIEGYQLKITLLSSQFKYKEIIDCYQEMIKIHLLNNSAKKVLASLYDKLALIMEYDGQYKEALELHKKTMAIREDILDSKHPDLASSYNNTGIIYRYSQVMINRHNL